MIRINLLPHREEKRKQREKSFYSLLALGAVAGARRRERVHLVRNERLVPEGSCLKSARVLPCQR